MPIFLLSALGFFMRSLNVAELHEGFLLLYRHGRQDDGIAARLAGQV
jgi:hypothetical protein